MAGSIEGLKYWEVEFDKAGGIIGDDNLQADLPASGVRDLFVFSHGWNSSERGAKGLYRDVFTLIAGMLTDEQRRTSGLVGVLWPSLLFPEDGPADDGSPAPTTTTPDGVRVPVESSGRELAEALKDKFPGQEQEVQTLGSLLDAQVQDGAALDRFHQLATGLVTTPETGGDEDNGEAAVLTASSRDVLVELAAAPGEPRADTQGLPNPLKLAWRGARELFRTTSYYEMKNRAGVIGNQGLGPLLGKLHQGTGGLRVHLMGHSFGARLVAFSLSGLPTGITGEASPVKSLLLIQGAFSHFAFSKQKPGALQHVTNRVDGPLLATFSSRDRAVGLWYPNASRLARQDNEASDDFNFRWGGMGHDGYQQDGVVDSDLLAQGAAYQLKKHTFYRLNSNNIIKKSLSAFSEAHSDIRHPEIAWAAVSAAGLVS
jgi:hypothetical protein